MGFVGNYAPCGLSPQTDGMPVILQKSAYPGTGLDGFFYLSLFILSDKLTFCNIFPEKSCFSSLLPINQQASFCAISLLGPGICAKMIATNIKTHPILSLTDNCSPRITHPASTEIQDSRLKIKDAMVGFIFFCPMI